MYYITMTDNFLSGWGEAENKTSKYVLMTEDKDKARIAYKNALKRPEMHEVEMRKRKHKPKYDQSLYHTSYKTENDAQWWFNENMSHNNGE